MYERGDLMKKRMLTMMIGAVGVIVVALAGWYVMFVHFGKGPAFPFLPMASAAAYVVPASEAAGTESLMALIDSEETAMEMAEQYGITFVSFEDGVATFHTDEDITQVIEKGEKNGYPPLYIDQKRELYDSQISEPDPSMIGEYSELEIKK